LEVGHEVVFIDSLVNSKREVLNRIHAVTGKQVAFAFADLLDRSAVTRVFQEHAIEGVLHFAGLKAVGESVHEPLRYLDQARF